MKQTFYSNGKLLLTGEYVVLDGALALALPTKFGQNLIVEPIPSEQILWKSFDQDGSVWFEDTLSFEEIQDNNTTPESVKTTLIKILLPNIKSSILTGIVLTFAHTVGEFGVVLMIGGSIPEETRVASIAVYDDPASFSTMEPSAFLAKPEPVNFADA